jgi:hypothetical protein
MTPFELFRHSSPFVIGNHYHLQASPSATPCQAFSSSAGHRILVFSIDISTTLARLLMGLELPGMEAGK